MDANLIQQVVQLMIFIIDVFMIENKDEVLSAPPPHFHPIPHIPFPDSVAAG